MLVYQRVPIFIILEGSEILHHQENFKNPTINIGIKHLSTGTGFLPSIVCIYIYIYIYVYINIYVRKPDNKGYNCVISLYILIQQNKRQQWDTTVI